jgi:hypothetical protein
MMSAYVKTTMLWKDCAEGAMHIEAAMGVQRWIVDPMLHGFLVTEGMSANATMARMEAFGSAMEMAMSYHGVETAVGGFVNAVGRYGERGRGRSARGSPPRTRPDTHAHTNGGWTQWSSAGAQARVQCAKSWRPTDCTLNTHVPPFSRRCCTRSPAPPSPAAAWARPPTPRASPRRWDGTSARTRRWTAATPPSPLGWTACKKHARANSKKKRACRGSEIRGSEMGAH